MKNILALFVFIFISIVSSLALADNTSAYESKDDPNLVDETSSTTSNTQGQVDAFGLNCPGCAKNRYHRNLYNNQIDSSRLSDTMDQKENADKSRR